MSRLSTDSDDTRDVGSRCATCRPYFEARARVLAPHIARVAFARAVSPAKVAADYMYAVHERHLSGLSLAVDA